MSDNNLNRRARIRVRPVLKKQPDLERLARALIELALADLAAADAAQAERSEPGTEAA